MLCWETRRQKQPNAVYEAELNLQREQHACGPHHEQDVMFKKKKRHTQFKKNLNAMLKFTVVVRSYGGLFIESYFGESSSAK